LQWDQELGKWHRDSHSFGQAEGDLGCGVPTFFVLRQVLASQVVAVLVEPVRVSTHEIELGLFLGLEVLTVVVACRGR
jgi:hypothetical protein